MLRAVDYANLWRYPGTYRWVSGEGVVSDQSARDSALKSDRVLTTGLPAGSYDLAAYQPPPNLFLLFAATPLTEEGIKNFADQYGLLGLGEREGGVALVLEVSPGDARPARLRLQGASANLALGSGELLSSWRGQVQAMGDATNLWSALRESVSGDPRRLSLHVKWLRDDCVYYDSHPHLPRPPTSMLLGIPPDASAISHREHGDTDETRTLAVIASRVINPEWLRWFRAGDCAMPARYYLQKSVNEKLKNRVSPKLLWNVRRNRPHDLALYFVPENLLGAMWLQFAEAINGNKPLRQCAACTSWIVISTEGTGRRSNRSTCSNACRMKIYYHRKMEARRLRQQGLSIKEIAKSLRANQKRVRVWVGPKEAGIRKRSTLRSDAHRPH